MRSDNSHTPALVSAVKIARTSMTKPAKLLRGGGAILLTAGVSITAFLWFGIVVPKWIYGTRLTDSAYGGMILSTFGSFAGAFSMLAFIQLAVFLYRRFLPKE